MKNVSRRFAALLLAASLCCGSFTACSGKQIDVRGLLGLSTSDSEEEEANLIQPKKGGDDVPYPDGFENSGKYKDVINGDTLCVAFNNIGIGGRDTRYFTVEGDSVTVTALAETESKKIRTFVVSLWHRIEGGTQYVEGHSIEFPADGELYTADLTDLEPGESYKLTISYDSGSYGITGGMSVDGLASAEEPTA